MISNDCLEPVKAWINHLMYNLTNDAGNSIIDSIVNDTSHNASY